MPLKALFLIFIGLISPFAFADSCLEGSGKPDFISLMNNPENPLHEKRASVLAGCSEIERPFENFQQTQNRTSLLDKTLQTGLRLSGGFIGTLFADMNGSPAQQKYKAKLEKIKMIKDRHERIHKTYELVVDTMGYYDRSLLGVPLDKVKGYGPNTKEYDVEKIVDRAFNMGSGGICRHHATLLAWSLNYVANREFRPEIKDGCNATYCHSWVGLTFPAKFSSTGKMQKVDLDTTNYQDFTYLNPKLNGVTKSEQKRILRICEQVSKCLADKIFNKAPARKQKTAPVQIPLLEGVN